MPLVLDLRIAHDRVGTYRLIGKLTAFLQLQEFSQRKHNMACSTSAAGRSLNNSKAKLVWLSLRQQPYVST